MMKRILVVDDEPDILELLVEVLRFEGYVVLAAGDGEAALELLTGAGPGMDLIVTDTMMPRLSGVEMVQSIRQHPDLRDIPVVVMSAAGRPGMEGLGASAFLPKPFDLIALLDVVAKAVERPPSSGSD